MSRGNSSSDVYLPKAAAAAYSCDKHLMLWMPQEHCRLLCGQQVQLHYALAVCPPAVASSTLEHFNTEEEPDLCT